MKCKWVQNKHIQRERERETEGESTIEMERGEKRKSDKIFPPIINKATADRQLQKWMVSNPCEEWYLYGYKSVSG